MPIELRSLLALLCVSVVATADDSPRPTLLPSEGERVLSVSLPPTFDAPRRETNGPVRTFVGDSVPAPTTLLDVPRPTTDTADSLASTLNKLPPATDKPRSLPPPGQQTLAAAKRPGPTSGKVVSTVVSSLAIVLGVFFVVAWISRRAQPKGSGPLPPEAVEMLGRATLAGKHQVHLVRVGPKLLLISVTPNGVETLTEIVDPDEVEHLSSVCRQNQPGSISASFRNVLTQLGREPTQSGFLDRDEDDEPMLAGRRGRRTNADFDD